MTDLSRARVLGAISAAVASPFAFATEAATKLDASDLGFLAQLLGTARQGVALYGQAAAAKILSAPVAAAVAQFANDHAVHRDTLVSAITDGGGQVPAATTQTLITQGETEVNFLATALAFERQTAGIYLNAIVQFTSRDLVKTAASIMGVDTTHVALLAEALRESPAYPTSFVS